MDKTEIKKLAVETDTILNDLYNKLFFASVKLQDAQSQVIREALKKTGQPSWDYKRSNLKYLEAVNIVGGESESVAKVEIEKDARFAIIKEIEPYETIYNSLKWSRAFLVPAGHIHKSRSCSSCYPTTQFIWYVEYSGSDEEAIVSDAGELACTICYPDAPVDILKQPSKFTEAQRAEVEAKRAERAEAKEKRDAEKREKSVSGDGSEFKVVYGTERYDCEYFKTERSAVIWASDKICDFPTDWKESRFGEAIEEIAEALAGKRGTDKPSVLAELVKKGLDKRKKYGW